MAKAKKPLAISIVIPACNEESQLAACLDTIAAQTVAPAEVLLVDNNSTDQTIKIARKYPFVKVLHEKQQGIVFARNRGFNAARSPIIGRIDADTHLPTDWVERVQAFYAEPAHQKLALTGGCVFYNIPCPRLDQWITSQFVFRMNRFLAGHYLLWGSNMALPRSAWKAVKLKACQRTDVHEDLDLAIHLHQLGYGINYQATLVVGAYLRRYMKNYRALWHHLWLWPQTLRVHANRKWPLGYSGAVFLFLMQPVPWAAAHLASWFGRGYKGLDE